MAFRRSRYPLQALGHEAHHQGIETSATFVGLSPDAVNGSDEEHSHRNEPSLLAPINENEALPNDASEQITSAHIETTLPASRLAPENEYTRRKKSLRRTAGSGRLKEIASQQSWSSRESLDEMSSLGSFSESKATDSILPTIGDDTESQRTCPVAAISSDPLTNPLAATTNDEVPQSGSMADQRDFRTQSSAHAPNKLALHHSGKAAYPSVSEETSNADTAIPTIGTFHRRTYPLQTPASHSNLRHPPTPPESPTRTEASFSTASPSASQAKPFRRSAYPLQAPATHTDLQQSLKGSHDVEGERESLREGFAAAGNAQHPNQYDPLRRSICPPQSAANVSDLQTSAISSELTQRESAEQAVPRQQRIHSTVKSQSIRLSAYPLQSPASIPNLYQQFASPSSPEDESDQAPLLRNQTDHGSSSSLRRSYRRSGYPLQSQASVPTLAETSPRDLGKEGVGADDRSGPEPILRRRGYPLQSNISPPVSCTSNSEQPERTQRSLRSATKQAREKELTTKVMNQWQSVVRDRTGPMHLPKHIRAVKDARQDDSKGRTIIVCLDGTGDKFDNDNSNIVYLISALKKDDPRQVTYYQAGIGTYGQGGLSGGLSAAADMAVGAGLGLHVRDAYHFLMQSYKEGDKICIFGFSRGAYTARCLAGMVHKVGLLPARNDQQIPFAYEFYSNDTHEGWQQSLEFKATFCIDVNVYFLGCFDSVASVGFIPRTLPLSSTPSNKPRYFRHAMSLDERRAKFKICRFERKTWDDIAKLRKSTKMAHIQDGHLNLTAEDYKRLIANEVPFDTDALEVWFAGDHADVGGGAVLNTERHKLAQIPLRWMIRQCFECDTGVLFKTKVLAEFGLDIYTLWPNYEKLSVPTGGLPQTYLQKYETDLPPKSVRGGKLVETNQHERGEPLYQLKSHTDEDWTPELVEDYYDVMSPLHDQLVMVPSWWILEVWPVEWKHANTPGNITINVGPNLGRYRCVEDVRPKVHWTVLRRGEQMGYKINARAAVGTEWEVVV